MARADVEEEGKFPAGLKVLVVDDDKVCLTVLERMLLQCRYEVTLCSKATEALTLLRQRQGGYHLVISDVHMPDMDGFKLLELVGLEMDLPVIMMSADARTNIVMKGIKHGACDYLIKPVRIEALQNIWQHVVRKKWTDSCTDHTTRNDNNNSNNNNNERDLEQSGSFEEHMGKRDEAGEYASSVNDGGPHRKRRCSVKEEEDVGDTESGDPSSSKKPRVVWSVELHQQFVNAVNQLGIDKAVPKRILELMNVPGLTRENVASHLQKFRLYLKRISGVAHHHPGLSNPFCGPVSTMKPGPLGSRLDFEALVASGHIPPQTIAALEEELFLQSSGTKPPPPIGAREIAFGQPLLKCGPHPLSRSQFSQSGINMGSNLSATAGGGLDLPPSYPNWPCSSNSSNNNNSTNNIISNDLTQLVGPVASEPLASINVQPSCLVTPSQTLNNTFQLGETSVLLGQNQIPSQITQIPSQSQSQSQISSYPAGAGMIMQQQGPMILPSQSLTGLQGVGPARQPYHISQTTLMVSSQPSTSGGSSVLDYSLLSSSSSSQMKNVRFGVGQIVDEGFKNVGPASNFNSNNNNNNNNFPIPRLVPLTAGSVSNNINNSSVNNNSSNNNSNNMMQMRRNNSLGFVGKGTCIPVRFAVDEIESPTNLSGFSHISGSGGDFANGDCFGLDGQI